MTRGPKPKVARLIEEYELDDLGDYLERRWTNTDDRAGLRQLADEVNVRLLECALDGTDEPPLEGELEHRYRLLHDDDVSRGTRLDVRNRLERQGVDVDGLTSDFVTRQAVHTYLTNYRGVTPPDQQPSNEDQRERRLQSIQRLRSRLETVTDSILSDLSDAGRLALGDFSVVVSVRVHCADCGTQVPVRTLLESGGCDCDRAVDRASGANK